MPFCGKKCRYCDFYSVSYTKKQAEMYCDAVLRNIRRYSDKNSVTDTVYFGGGTPSLLTAGQISQYITAIKEYFNLSPDAEITLEANPNTLVPEKLTALRNAGVNRLSIGIQSMNNDELRFLGRTHTAERAGKAVRDACSAGFDNISCDLMIALPNQTVENIRYSIQRISELPVSHISAYILKIEDGTAFDCDEIRNAVPDDDTSADLYLAMVRELKNHGFMQYEVSNFAKSGFESRHNSRYWKSLDYIGIGVSSHSFLNGIRFAVEPDLQKFIDSPVQPITITDRNAGSPEEFAMLRLRLSEGLDLNDVKSKKDSIIKKIPPLIKAGYVNLNNETVSLTEKGFIVSNSIIEYLIF